LVLLVLVLLHREIQQTEVVQHLQLLFPLAAEAGAVMALRVKGRKMAALAGALALKLELLGLELQIKATRQPAGAVVGRVVMAGFFLMVVMEFLHLLLVRPLRGLVVEAGLDTHQGLGPLAVEMVALTQERGPERQLLQTLVVAVGLDLMALVQEPTAGRA
jgi:hypothetical protein